MTRFHPIVFLIDVDNTLLDNDGIQQDFKDHLRHPYGDAVRSRHWKILESGIATISERFSAIVSSIPGRRLLDREHKFPAVQIWLVRA